MMLNKRKKKLKKTEKHKKNTQNLKTNKKGVPVLYIYENLSVFKYFFIVRHSVQTKQILKVEKFCK